MRKHLKNEQKTVVQAIDEEAVEAEEVEVEVEEEDG